MKYRSTILVAILAMAASALLAACNQAVAPASGTDPNASATRALVAPVSTAVPTQTPAPTLTLAPTAAPTSANPLEVFAKAQAALVAAKTDRLTIHITKSGKTDTTVMEAITGVAFRDTPSSGDETIIIKGQGMYIKKNNKWSKAVLSAKALDPLIANINPTSFVDKLKQRLDVKATPQIGADLLDAKPMVTYTYNAQGGTAKLWYGVTDGWLYKLEFDDPNGSQTVGTIEYNIPLTIAPPI